MKRFFIISFLAVAGIILFSACNPKAFSGKPGSSGKTLELMVVAKNSVYGGSTDAVLDSLFRTPQDGLNQPEPRFDVVQIAPSSFDGNTMFQAHRNILMLEVDPTGLNKVYLEYDKWASPQVIIRIVAQTKPELDSMLLANGERLLKEYYNMEYARMKKVFTQSPNVKINRLIKEKYGFALSIPEEFAMNKQEGDFTWVRKETKDFGLHIYVYTEPAGDSKELPDEAFVLDKLDTLMKHHVSGPADGSYQGTERRDFFYSREAMIGDHKALETRGLWRLYGDFMGGPFVCYTFQKDDRMVYLVGLVYSPSQRNKMVMKRDLLMQVDGICHSYQSEN